MPNAITTEIDAHFNAVGSQEVRQRRSLNPTWTWQKPSGGVMLSQPDVVKFDNVVSGSGFTKRQL